MSTPRTPPASDRVLDKRPATTRELEVLHLVALGYTNDQVGTRLYLSSDTVKTHLRRLFAKIGARDRAHAVSQGFRYGLLRVVTTADGCDQLAVGTPIHTWEPM